MKITKIPGRQKLEPLKEFKKYISITVSLTTECNYKCWYCYQNNMKRETQIYYKDVLKFVKQVQDKYPEKEILVLLIGGETLYYKDINPLIEELYNMNIKIDITTNGSKSEKWWKKYGKMIENISVSYHHNEVQENKFIEQCKYIVKNTRRHLSIPLMIEPEYFDEILEFGERLANEIDNLIVLPKPINNALVFDNFQNFTSEQRQKMINIKRFRSKNIKFIDSPFDSSDMIITQNNVAKIRTLNDIILKGETNFEGMKCYGGIEQFFIDYDGSIYTSNCLIKKIGNLNNPITLPNKPVICNKSYCYCRIDVQTTKEINAT